MKDLFIKLMLEAGATQADAESTWTVFIAKVCKGREPTSVSLKFIADEKLAVLDDPIAEGVIRAIRDGKADTTAPTGGVKPKKFKADKARLYTPAELVAFLVREASLSPDDKTALRAEVTRRTGGAPFRFLIDGNLAEAETAERIRALYERDPVAPFVAVAGKEVEPVGFDADPVKTFAEDPFERGVALGAPGDVSNKLGVSLAGIPHEVRQALRVAVDHDLNGASRIELIRAAEHARGKTADEVLAAYPNARRAWVSVQKPELQVRPRPTWPSSPTFPAAPGGKQALPGGSDSAPLVYVVGGENEPQACATLRKHMQVHVRQGHVRVIADNDAPTRADFTGWRAARLQEASVVVVLLSANTLATVDTRELAETGKRIVPVLVRACSWESDPHIGKLQPLPRDRRPAGAEDERWAQVANGVKAAAVSVTDDDVLNAVTSAQIDRTDLLVGIDLRLVAQLRTAGSPGTQIRSDYFALKDVRLGDGRRPIMTWLQNAVEAAGPRVEAQVFQRALAAL